MGSIEEKSKRKARRGEIQGLILEAVKLAGVLTVGLMAPNVLSSMNKLGIISTKRHGEIVKSSASKLARRGLLKFNGKYYELTKEGEKKLKQFSFLGYKFSRPEKWDKKWRVIIFDISEKKRVKRDQIRNIFVAGGFYRLQNSVWVYPYDCEEIIGLLKTDLSIGKEVLYMIVDEIENDKYLREFFELKPFHL